MIKKILDGRYSVSDNGKIFSHISNRGTIDLKKNKLKKTQITNAGYEQVNLQDKDGKRIVYSVHRLVAELFVCNKYNKPIVNHIDGNKLNNSASNLEWCTRSENDKHAFKNGLRKPDKSRKGVPNKKLNKRICQFDINDNLITIWDSMADAQRHGYSQGNIAMCCSGRRKTHKGFKWKIL